MYVYQICLFFSFSHVTISFENGLRLKFSFHDQMKWIYVAYIKKMIGNTIYVDMYAIDGWIIKISFLFHLFISIEL